MELDTFSKYVDYHLVFDIVVIAFGKKSSIV